MVDGVEFLRLMHRFKAIRGGKKKGFLGLNISELLCVMLIRQRSERGEDINLSDISRELGISKPAVSQLVNKLEWKRVIKRVRNKQDKKIINLELSPRVKNHFDKHSNEHSGLLKAIGDELGDELDLFVSFSERIITVVENYYNTPSNSDE